MSTEVIEGNGRTEALLTPGRQPRKSKGRVHKMSKWSAQRRANYAATMAAKKNGEVLPKTAEVAKLRAEGLSAWQIAKSLKMSENAVYTRIHRLEQDKPKRTVSIPLHAVPARMPARAELPRSPMRIAIKAGSELTVTIGGVEVNIVAEER